MNLDIYTSEMAKSIWDKAFFMDKVPGVKCVLDFGCADGAMIRYLSTLFPDIIFVGYDINIDLIARARSIPPFNSNLIYFHEASFDDMIKYIKSKVSSDKLCINFSSVLHEVCSSTGGLDVIKDLIDKLEPKYLTIRDMYSDEELPLTHSDWPLKICKKIEAQSENFICSKEFVSKFGLLKTWSDLTHLLMKLQWKDNGWEDEMKENYYSWTLDILLLAVCNKYNPVFECRYQLPYLTEKWKEEYGWYNPDIHTHAQFILRRDD